MAHDTDNDVLSAKEDRSVLQKRYTQACSDVTRAAMFAKRSEVPEEDTALHAVTRDVVANNMFVSDSYFDSFFPSAETRLYQMKLNTDLLSRTSGIGVLHVRQGVYDTLDFMFEMPNQNTIQGKNAILTILELLDSQDVLWSTLHHITETYNAIAASDHGYLKFFDGQTVMWMHCVIALSTTLHHHSFDDNIPWEWKKPLLVNELVRNIKDATSFRTIYQVIAATTSEHSKLHDSMNTRNQ